MGKAPSKASKLKKAKKKPSVIKSKKPTAGVVKPCVTPKLVTGTVASYGDLLKTKGDGSSDRDHMPSYKALEKRALALKGKPLSSTEKSKVKRAGEAMVLPKSIHNQGRTYGGKNTDAQSSGDALDLHAAVKKDVMFYKKIVTSKSVQASMQKMIMSNKQYDARLKKCLDP
jgi:hypothetical protein